MKFEVLTKGELPLVNISKEETFSIQPDKKLLGLGSIYLFLFERYVHSISRFEHGGLFMKNI